jgi:FkbM family methyltransferase
MGIVSYAQNFEDVMLWRALGHVPNGFYIDVGAQHPIIDSVSKAFYEHGWRGIHVEATHAYAEMLRKDRPDELVMETALSDKPGTITFYEIPDTGLSTGDKSIADNHRAQGYDVKELTITCATLENVFSHVGSMEIHWLKIDVEGMERFVLQGWGNAQNSPWILTIESTYPNSQSETHLEWQDLVFSRGYHEVYFDGLSRYYVSNEHVELAKNFYSPPNIFDQFTVALNSPYAGAARQLIAESDEKNKSSVVQVNKLQLEIEQASQLIKSLKQQKTSQIEERVSQIQLSQVSLQKNFNKSLETQEHLKNSLLEIKKFHVQQEQYLQKELNDSLDKQNKLSAMVEICKVDFEQLKLTHQTGLKEYGKNLEKIKKIHAQELQKQIQLASDELRNKTQSWQEEKKTLLKNASITLTAEREEKSQLLHQQIKREQEFFSTIKTSKEIADAEKNSLIKDFAIKTESLMQKIEQVVKDKYAAESSHLKLTTILKIENKAYLEKSAIKEDLHNEVVTRLRSEAKYCEDRAQIYSNELLESKRVLDQIYSSSLWSLFHPWLKLKSHSKLHSIDYSQLSTMNTATKLQMENSYRYDADSIKAAKNIQELMSYNDMEFIQCAYKTMLGRNADAEGMTYYLSKIRAGHAKQQLLAQIYLSKECQDFIQKRPKLKDNTKRFQWLKKPIIGNLIRRIGLSIDHTKLKMQLRSIENTLYLLQQQLQSQKNLNAEYHGNERGGNLASNVLTLSPNAKEIYRKLKEAANINHQRANV